jgi:ADP-heptose:LPS heptosyltransferase
MPYLKPNLTLSERLRAKINKPGIPICGVTWKSFREELGLNKSLDIESLAAILYSRDITFINLQYGDVDEDLEQLKQIVGYSPFFPCDIDNKNDIDGHAALVSACDHLLLINNATAHIAGALGKKSLLLTPSGKSSIWYWNHNDTNLISSWYPSIEIARQQKSGVWREPVLRAIDFLKHCVSATSKTHRIDL